MGERQKDLLPECSADRNGARTRHESQETPQSASWAESALEAPRGCNRNYQEVGRLAQQEITSYPGPRVFW